MSTYEAIRCIICSHQQWKYGTQLFLLPLNQINILIVSKQVHKLRECVHFMALFIGFFFLPFWLRESCLSSVQQCIQGLIMHLHRHSQCTHTQSVYSFAIEMHNNAPRWAITPSMELQHDHAVAFFFYTTHTHLLIHSVSHLPTLPSTALSASFQLYMVQRSVECHHCTTIRHYKNNSVYYVHFITSLQ